MSKKTEKPDIDGEKKSGKALGDSPAKVENTTGSKADAAAEAAAAVSTDFSVQQSAAQGHGNAGKSSDGVKTAGTKKSSGAKRSSGAKSSGGTKKSAKSKPKKKAEAPAAAETVIIVKAPTQQAAALCGGEHYDAAAPSRKRRTYSLVLGSVIVTLLCVILLLIFTAQPVERYEPFDWSTAPVIEASDIDGDWGEKETLTVFPDGMNPGSSGKYRFVINNPNDFDVAYSFYMEPKSVVRDGFFPVRFKLRMNNQLIGPDGWQAISDLKFEDIELLSGTSHAFTLEWEWPFESGNDELDTEIGRSWSSVGLTVYLLANHV